MTSSFGITVPRNNFLYQSIEETMQLLIPAGIPQYLWKFHYEYFYQISQQKKRHIKSPHVLTWNELSFGFVVWFVSCGIAVLCFIVEFVKFYVLGRIFAFNIGEQLMRSMKQINLKKGQVSWLGNKIRIKRPESFIRQNEKSLKIESIE